MKKYYQFNACIYLSVDNQESILIKLESVGTEISIYDRGHRPVEFERMKEISAEDFKNVYKSALKRIIAKM
ncbi:hypothetical protein [Chryseobacterium sp.]|uniref:hypothetical protein n=1 Tax=Chryseobacterium sp. TaxID=1871047 RepID=UPI00289638B8|nr:hypothetical protein [Chryseobacterium sp.]